MRDLANFTPGRTIAALERVRESHKERVGEQALVSESLIASVRRRLLAVDADSVARLARELSPLEVRAVLQLLVQSEPEIVHERAQAVVEERPRRDLGPAAWRLLVAHFPARTLEYVLRRLARVVGWPAISPSVHVETWFRSEELCAGILNDYVGAGAGTLGAWLTDLGVPDRSGLHRETWRYLLAQAPKPILQRFAHAVLLARAKQEVVAVQGAFARNYLVALEERASWDATVLAWIKQQYGTPLRTEQQTAFWRKIPEPVRMAFRRWVNEREIQSFFERVRDPHGRFEFWKRYIDEIQEVQLPLGDEAMLMDFGRFGVAEFSDVGNAAYVYNAATFRRIAGLQQYSLGRLKEKRSVAFRIIHKRGWEREYGPRIDHLVRNA